MNNNANSPQGPASAPNVSSSSPAPLAAGPSARVLAVVPPAAPPVKTGPSVKALAVGAIVVAAVAAFGGRLWWVGQNFAETDNAFVTGHVHPVSARIAGVVTRVDAEDNSAVKAGQALLVLDPADQQVQLDRLKAQLAQVDAQITGSASQIAQARAQAAAAQAQTAQSAALLVRSERDAERAQRLFNGELRAISKQELDAASASRDAAVADVAARKASERAAAQTIQSSAASRDAAVAQRGVLQAQIKEAEQQLSYTTVVAPNDGRVGKRMVEVGQRVQPGQQLLAVVQDEVWITANFKETQLAKMRPGQSVTVHLDALPGRELHAKVQSFSPASGAQFALLPADNATGNFTKIVQRVPVKVVIDAKDAAELKGRLVPGLSATVSVDLRG